MTDAKSWRPAPNYEGYSACTDGRVRNDKTGRVLKPSKNKVGYATSKLTLHGEAKTINMHRVVANAFWGDAPEGMIINHQDGNRMNNALSNLEYVTRSANVLHGRRKAMRSAQNPEDLALISREQWAEVVRLLNEGETRQTIARRLGVSTVHLWKHFHKHVRYVLAQPV